MLTRSIIKGLEGLDTYQLFLAQYNAKLIICMYEISNSYFISSIKVRFISFLSLYWGQQVLVIYQIKWLDLNLVLNKRYLTNYIEASAILLIFLQNC